MACLVHNVSLRPDLFCDNHLEVLQTKTFWTGNNAQEKAIKSHCFIGARVEAEVLEEEGVENLESTLNSLPERILICEA